MDEPLRNAQRRRWAAAAAALLVVAGCLAVFAPTFSAGLVNWDDEPGIARNHAFRGLDGEHLGWMFTTSTLGHYQPLAWLSLALDHWLFGLSGSLDAPEAGAFHRTSVLLHALTAVLVLGLAYGVLRRALPRARPPALGLGALLAALLFAVHPLRAESVAWLTERRDVLSGLFFVGALWAWWASLPRETPLPELRPGLAAAVAALTAAALALAGLDLSGPAALGLTSGGAALLVTALVGLLVSALLAARVHPGSRRATALRLLAVGLALASLLSKAWGIVLPALLLVVDVWPLDRLAAAGTTRARRAAALLVEKAPFLALSAVFARIAAWAQASQPGTMLDLDTHTLSERVLQALYGLVWYPLKTLLPLGLSPYVEVPAQIRLAQPRFLVPALIVGAVVVALLLLRRRAPALLAAALSFAVIVAPVLGLAQSGPQLVADRYSYLAGLPLALAAAGGLVWLGLRRERLAPWLVAASGLWVLVLGLAGRAQAAVWSSSQSLWSHALEVDPANGYAAQKLAQVRLEQAARAPQPDERALRVAQALELLASNSREDDPIWLSTLARAQLERARAEPARRAELVGRAVELSRRAVGLRRDAVEPDLRLNLATALIEAGQPDQAVGELRRYVEARPYEPLGWTNLGVALAASGSPGEARAHLRRSLELDPSYAKGWQFLAQACEQVGDREGALDAWRRLLELWPRSELARERVRALGG